MDLGRAEEGSAGETEATLDAGEDSRGFGGGLAVGEGALDMHLLGAAVGEGARDTVVAVGVVITDGVVSRRRRRRW